MSEQEEIPEITLSRETVIGFLGAGRIAVAMTRGFIDAGLVPPNNIITSCPSQSNDTLKEKYGVQVVHDNLSCVKESDIVILAVKPYMVDKVLSEIQSELSNNKLLVSVVSGITIARIEQNLPAGTRVVRAMPNTPALVLSAASAYSLGSTVRPTDGPAVNCLLSCIGVCEPVPEHMLDAVTGLSGSGPAYGFVAVEALADGAVKMGIPRPLATKFAAQALLGAAKMVLDTGRHPAELKDEVCSPAGTTITALHKLEAAGFRMALMNAVEAATIKAKEMGRK